jgi:urea carboxylase-associated protein 2
MSNVSESGRPNVFEEIIPGGAMWSAVVPRHHSLRLVDVEGGANVSMLLYNRDHLLERYNMPDTLKAQHTAILTTGHVLYSDMGRILCSITDDGCGYHDTFSGVSDAALVSSKYGVKNYQEARNGCHRNGRDQLLTELAKWGLGLRDLVPNVNWFSRVAADAEGKLGYHVGHSTAGSHVELRTEMNVLVVLTTCQHPLDPAPTYAPKPVQISVRRTAEPGPDDVCRVSRPENARGFTNNEQYFRFHG